MNTKIPWVWCAVLAVFFFTGNALGLVPPAEPLRFDRLAVADPSGSISALGEKPESLAEFEKEQVGWRAFRAAFGQDWRVFIDRRSGVPLLVEGPGIPWFPSGQTASLEELQTRARELVKNHSVLFKVADTELVLNLAGSGPVDADHWVLVFDRVIQGIPVENQRFVLYVTRGNLVAFGADRWGEVTPVQPVHDQASARRILRTYMGLGAHQGELDVETPRLVYIGLPVGPSGAAAFAGVPGKGLEFALAWRFLVRVEGEEGLWLGKVDAVTGKILAFYDDTRYGQVRGGVYPLSNDGLNWEGTEQAGFPMPWADVTINGSKQNANDMGLFPVGAAGSTATTALAGTYVKIQDGCGTLSESGPANGNIDLLQGTGTDCAVPVGDSSGNTHAARTAYYHITRAKERALFWLPDNTWVQSQQTVNANSSMTCNATYGGSINLGRSQAGNCRNLGEIGAVAAHEWGHGLDANDGGSWDSPNEGYADSVALLHDRSSCSGRGAFYGNCDGYGDVCLDCTGVRELDWDKHASHTPATPAGFVANNCSWWFSGGPCGRETHCEGAVVAQTVWDLATRDLPAQGLSPARSWQLTEKLFYKSRKGSGGNAYNCSLPNSDGCNASSWFTKFRTADDEDGNLSNGTRHAAAIFAAFNRHKIACGTAADASNKNHSSCPTLTVPTVTGSAECGAARLNWTTVVGASKYFILRNDQGCDASSVVIATVSNPSTAYTDTDVPGGFPVYYRVQAQGTNAACDGGVSLCVPVTPDAAGTAPAEVASVAADRLPSATRITWPSSGAGIRYDLASGNLLALLSDHNYSGATCAANDLTTATWDDTRANPAAGNGYYYLVRGQTSCATGSYGQGSNGTVRAVAACP